MNSLIHTNLLRTIDLMFSNLANLSINLIHELNCQDDWEHSDTGPSPAKGVVISGSFDAMAADVGRLLLFGAGVASSPRGAVTRPLC
jgi:hypothetical protein